MENAAWPGPDGWQVLASAVNARAECLPADVVERSRALHTWRHAHAGPAERVFERLAPRRGELLEMLCELYGLPRAALAAQSTPALILVWYNLDVLADVGGLSARALHATDTAFTSRHPQPSDTATM